MSARNLFSEIQLGANHLPNRIVMAPMTRLRAVGGIPNEIMAEYYRQRALAGLIVTECTMVSPMSNGYMNCPGIYSPEQIAGWQVVTDAVHQAGGKIFLQLWHSGPISHPTLLDGKQPVAPSAIPPVGMLHTPAGKVTIETPRALEPEEITGIVEEFRQAAKNAMQAGFDGVELHGAFGYLIDRFLQDGSNQRTDIYGGSVENRARFLLEVVEAVCQVWGGERVGIKLSPSNTFYGMHDSNPVATFGYAIQQLDRFNLAYVHLMEPSEDDLKTDGVINPVLATFRPFYSGLIITNGNYDKARGNQAIASEEADLVSFGRPFIANPDLPQRFAIDAPLNEVNFATVYGKGDRDLEHGYTDYPALAR
ncbi:alkene reductase [Calothrix sp. UHCC 0171]|uniref:alkene reductase n=1 Tax=Calothrix sp. UHCC 0171 TaxID=3110245 RepID=UPI002B1EA73F|nr:alkene reductase [Calothrix sp. UHCC 0171]MEA5574435.1 alkene reductase [Calothrix sp. UHCC 0171]